MQFSTSLPEFSFLNAHLGEYEWRLNYSDQLGYLVSSEKISQQQRQNIKEIAAQKLPKITLYEDPAAETLSFNRREIKSQMKGEQLLNPIEKIITTRRSGYHFDPSRFPSREQLNRMFDTARYTPSAYNEQPWRFILCNRATHPESYDKLYHLLPQHTKPWIGDAPVLVIITSAVRKKTDTPTGTIQVSNNQWTLYDTGAAAIVTMLVASSLGLMTHQIGGFDTEEISQAFSIEKGFKPIAVMAIGYKNEEKMKPKERKPLNEILFNCRWGKSDE